MSTSLRVLHVVNSLEPGGMENGVANLARALAPRGIETHVACLERRGPFAERLPAPELVAVMGKSGGFSPHAALRLSRHIARIRPIVVHTHNLGPLIYTSLATLGGLRCPIIHGEHSQLTAEEREPRRLRQRRVLYRACRAVHTVSQGIRAELLALGFPSARLTLITNGVDTARFAPGDRAAARRALGLPAEALIIGIIGRFGPYKGHAVLLEAFEQLTSRYPSAHLLIVGGGGSEEARIAAQAARSAHRERIHLAGFQPDPLRSYQALDLLAIPSTNEGLSNAALEAMSCGVPVLANTGCGHEQIITSGADGLIASLHTPAALAAQLAALLADPAILPTFRTSARQTIEARFSLTGMVDAYERLYRSAPR